MNHRTLRFALIASTLTALACGPVSVSPTDADGGADAGPAPSAECDPVALFASEGDALASVAYGATDGGHIVAGSTRAGAVFVQAFDGRFAPVGARVALRPAEATAPAGLRELRLFVDGARVAVTYNQELFELSSSASSSPTLMRSLRAPDTSPEPSIVSVWWRAATNGSPISIDAVTNDGGSWSASTDAFRSLSTSSDALSWGSHAHSTGDGGYLAFEPRWRRDVNNYVQISKRIVGHGSLIVTSSRSEVGTAVSPVTRVGDELWRLQAANSEPSNASVRLGLSLVRHDRQTGETVGSAVLSPSLTLALSPSGAIAAAPGDTDGARALLTWTQRVSETRSQIVAQWGPTGPSRVVGDAGEALLMTGASVEPGASRGWALYLAVYPRPGAPMPAVRAFARCVPR
jgi:hypothetical protein